MVTLVDLYRQRTYVEDIDYLDKKLGGKITHALTPSFRSPWAC
jgi:hypothetical protein